MNRREKAAARGALIRTLELHAAVLEGVPPRDWNDHSPYEEACIHMGRTHWRVWVTAAAHERMAKNFRRLPLRSMLPWTYHEKACGR